MTKYIKEEKRKNKEELNERDTQRRIRETLITREMKDKTHDSERDKKREETKTNQRKWQKQKNQQGKT